MNSQTHILIAAAVLGRRAPGPRDHMALLAGAIIPDFFMVPFILYGAAQGMTSQEMWGVAYWQEPWQSFSALSNSIPLYLTLFIVGLRYSPLLQLFSLAALFHVGLDFLTHADDAHRHFWPLTNWTFFSPVSYWDVNYYGLWVSLGEVILGLFLIAVLWRRYKALWVRMTLGVIGLSYPAMAFFWIVALGTN